LKGQQAPEFYTLTNAPVSAEAIQQLSSLKYIGVLATGYNIVNTKR
jgi:lactate dehydrogenase-like 2-hydroxyacid dehydrogenase